VLHGKPFLKTRRFWTPIFWKELAYFLKQRWTTRLQISNGTRHNSYLSNDVNYRTFLYCMHLSSLHIDPKQRSFYYAQRQRSIQENLTSITSLNSTPILV
jgi:hypothetical protein